MNRMKRYVLAGLAALPFAACVGSIGQDAGHGGPAGDSTPGKMGPVPPGAQPPGTGRLPSLPGQNSACQEAPPPVQATRRMTRDQYLATVRDLLGDSRDLGDRLPADDKGEAVFAPPETLIVTPDWADKLLVTAEDLARQALTNLPALLPCNPAGNEDACATEFIEAFGKRAFRRPLVGDEVTGCCSRRRMAASWARATGSPRRSTA
jgi:hypothetical protein